MNRPVVIGHIRPTRDGGEPRVWAYCAICRVYRRLENVRPWPGIGEHYGECQCGNSMFGQPDNGGDAA